jgi:hypothetical protein
MEFPASKRPFASEVRAGKALEGTPFVSDEVKD